MYDNLIMVQKTIIITGGNRGIGLEITRTFVEAGYHVVVGARNAYDLEKEFGDQVTFVKVDVRKESDHVLLTEIAIKKTGRIDCYVNNAGFSEWRPIEEIDEAFLDDILNTNLKGAFWGCKAAAKVLGPEGTIINISSIAGKRGSSNNSAYVASKFGMNGLTQSLAKELGPKQIRVLALCPVLISTDGLLDALQSPYAPANGNPETFISNFAKGNSALLRLPTGREVGNMCVFLASNSASAMTGQCINVDCGVLPQ
jgi:3-oxoacyl-[acyl-carrier protein] reductase/meso-butanediol dehydrogenase/(S,S)-butanediol dehydrogenase/diacetyl reductase